jgi:hypothetical protein
MHPVHESAPTAAFHRQNPALRLDLMHPVHERAPTAAFHRQCAVLLLDLMHPVHTNAALHGSGLTEGSGIMPADEPR